MDDLRLDDIRGRVVHFFYLILRSDTSLPRGHTKNGAISVKVELWGAWDPSSNSVVYLYNNYRQDDPRACLARDILTYQQFHLTGAIDYCLEFRFHNPLGKFNTADPPERRARFAFPSPTWRDYLPWNRNEDPVFRQSLILNYMIPADGLPICIPFRITVPFVLSKARVILDDLLEDSNSQPLPRIWWEK
jgi:hypothetical protein